MMVYIALLHFGGHHNTADNHQSTAVEHVFIPEPMKLLDFNNKLEAESKKSLETSDNSDDDEVLESDYFSEEELFEDDFLFVSDIKNLENQGEGSSEQREDRD